MKKIGAENTTPKANVIKKLVTYKQAQYSKVLHYSRLERFAFDKHSSLFISYKENEVLRIQHSRPML
jgi:hypothetical protein